MAGYCPRRTFLVAAAVAFIALAAIPVASPTAQAQPAAPVYVPGEVLVTYRPGASATHVLLAARSVHAAAAETIAFSGVQRLRLEPGVSTEAALRALNANPAVAYAQPNFIYHAANTPNDPQFTGGNLWGLSNWGQLGGTSGCDIGATSAWDLTTGSSSVAVAVVDTGIDYNHPDLAPNVWTNPGEIAGNGLDDDGDGYVDDVHGWNAVANNGDPMDDHGHGSHVSGTIGAAGNNATGVVGVNWNVKIIGCKFLDSTGSGTTAGAVTCIDYVNRLKDRGVNVVGINASWGGGPFDQTLYDAIERANSRGILFMAAAGNGNSYGQAVDIDTRPFYPAAYTNTNVISVTATDRNDLKAVWANYGATSVDLGAPGVSITSTLPGNSYGTWDGTSMATPHVTGTVALLKAYNPGLSAAQVKSAILNSGDPIPALSGITVTGKRLNAFKALQSAGGGGTSSPPGAPASLTASAGNAQVSLSWSPGSGASTYSVKRALVSGGPYTTVASTAGTGYTDASVINGTTYYYVVSAVSASGESANSNQAAATPTAPAAPSAPANLRAAGQPGQKCRINLTWTQSSSTGVTQNRVYRSTISGGPYTRIASLSATTAFNDSSIVRGVTYYYRVTAVNGSGVESAYSNQAAAAD